VRTWSVSRGDEDPVAAGWKAETPPEGEGETQGSEVLRIHERKGQPGTSGGPVFPGSTRGKYRLVCDRDSEAPVVLHVVRGNRHGVEGRRSAREEDTPKRVRRERGERLGEGTRAPLPCLDRKILASIGGPREPHERSGHETRPAWFWAKEDVERVRNPEDGRCRRLESPGHTGA
jgi:hypothetical protein